MVELSHSHREHHAFNAFSPLQSQLAINHISHHLGEVTEMVYSVKISAQILGDIPKMVYSVKVSNNELN